MKHVKLQPINLRSHPVINEAWVQQVICEDPSVLGIGEVVVKDRERVQAGAGRLDLLLQDADGHGRYEVEIQLGPTDPSHIIRTIEYWDHERKHYPQYDHTAVIVAEDITSRFLNVINLFNGTIPIMAIQMKAVAVEGGASLLFTKILDTVSLGLVDDDEEVNETVDRAYWEHRASVPTVKLADEILSLCADFPTKPELSFNKHYIGFRVNGKACNFATCRPRKKAMVLNIKLASSEEVDAELDKLELDLLEYDAKWKEYRIRLSAEEISKNAEFLKSLLRSAFDVRNAS